MASRQWKRTFYDEVTVYSEDRELLQPGQWLNDNILSLYFAYLAHEVFPYPAVLFVPPPVSFMLSMIEDPTDGSMLEELARGLELRSRELVLVAINDNTDVSRSRGGSHWALLVYVQKAQQWKYFDSLGASNMAAAQRMAVRLGVLVAPHSAPVGGKPTVHICPCTRQRNGYDCGPYTLLAAEVIAGRFLRGEDLDRSFEQGAPL
eukprot:RCo010287